MYQRLVVSLAVVSLCFAAGCKKETEKEQPAPTTPAPITSPTPTGQPATGEALFKQHCAVCHPDGGNTINPKKTLHRKDMAANKITKPEHIVNNMRNPGPGMTRFDKNVISDEDAMKIGQYILDTYK